MNPQGGRKETLGEAELGCKGQDRARAQVRSATSQSILHRQWEWQGGGEGRGTCRGPSTFPPGPQPSPFPWATTGTKGLSADNGSFI